MKSIPIHPMPSNWGDSPERDNDEDENPPPNTNRDCGQFEMG